MVKICIWMDVPSHYQSAFFAALARRADVDLQVCYMKGVSDRRAAQGWRSDHDFKPYEHETSCAPTAVGRLEFVPDWRERIHIISSYISRELIDYFCEHGVRWCHWSEAPGIRLAEALGYRMNLFRLLHPVMLKLKRKDGSCMRKHAVLVFGQGDMATRSFRTMGVDQKRLKHLFYVPEPLPDLGRSEKIEAFACGRKVFAAVGALMKRKGVDLLLKAFRKLETDDWCLVLCGMDKSGGAYERMAEELGIADRVLFLGAYPIDRIAEVYGSADVFVLPSRFDGWGAVENEAASLGLPIIGTDLCGASWHMIDDGKNGYRVRAGDAAALYKAMNRYVQCPEKLEAHGAYSKAVYLSAFTPDANAERLVTALCGLEGDLV